MNDPESYGRGPERRAGPDLAEIPVTAAGDSRTHGVPLDLEAPASTRSTGESDGPSQPQCCAAPRSAGCNRISHHVPREPAARTVACDGAALPGSRRCSGPLAARSESRSQWRSRLHPRPGWPGPASDPSHHDVWDGRPSCLSLCASLPKIVTLPDRSCLACTAIQQRHCPHSAAPVQ